MAASRTRTQHLALLPFLLALLFLASAEPASAQYMYLDSNGDETHTAADQVNPSGITTIEIWLDIAENRDGSKAECADDGDPYDFFSYVFGLRVSDGTVSWGPFINGQSTMAVHFGRRESETEYMDGYGGLTVLPAGRYRLGTIVMTTLTGTPRVEVVPTTTIFYEQTSFGSTCVGSLFDSTIRLGVEWTDTDGLPFGTVQPPNGAPTVGPVNPMTTVEGAAATQAVSASDPDGQNLLFSKITGPDFFHVATLDPAAGLGELFAFPRKGDAGPEEGSFQVTDGLVSVSRTVVISVGGGPNHPPSISAVPPIAALAERITIVDLAASDADGDEIELALESGPSYASVVTLRGAAGGATGQLRLAPGFCDVGEARVLLRASDGATPQTREIAIQVVPLSPAPANTVRRAPTYRFPVGVVLLDLNVDGHLDAVTSSFTEGISVYAGLGDGRLDPRTILENVPAGSWPSALASGDLNGDAYPDIAVANYLEPTVTVLLGRSNGTLERVRAYETGGGSSGVAIADLDGDGRQDLAVTNSASNTVSVLLGAGDGTFGPKRETPVGETPVGVAVSDLDLDGIPDLVVTNQRDGSLSVLLGVGNGFFQPRRDIEVGGNPVAVSAADFNADGAVDLVVSNYGANVVQMLPGNGDASFAAPLALPTREGARPQLASVGDLDADGLPDLAVSDVGTGFVILNRGGFTFSEPALLVTAFGTAMGDLNEDGFIDIALVNEANRGEIWTVLNDRGGPGSVAARAFATGPSRTVGLGTHGPDVCLRLEPIGGSYQNQDVDLNSVVLRSTGTGSVDVIRSVPAKRATEADSDRNGIPEIPVCFAPADVSLLLSELSGSRVVAATLQGSLLDGRPFCSAVTLNFVGGGNTALAASVYPNPLNPRATLRYSTSRDGFVKVRMYDLQGRLVRTLVEHPLARAGDHEVEIDGRSQNGQPLASGIYFYDVEAAEGTVRGRLTILK